MLNFKKLVYLPLIIGLAYLSQASYILAKAYLAEHLIDRAFEKSLISKRTQKPWSWSDSYPIAKIHFQSSNKSYTVLENAIGRNLAFAPSRLSHGGMPGEPKSTVISAHNDTHFSHLKESKKGDLIKITTQYGEFEYRINKITIVDSSQSKIPIKNKEELILTTCYPFGNFGSNTPLRFVVIASPKV